MEDVSVVLAGTATNDAGGIPIYFRLCELGKWNQPVQVETALGPGTMVSHLKIVFHRTRHHFRARLAYVFALIYVVLGLEHRLALDTVL